MKTKKMKKMKKQVNVFVVVQELKKISEE